MVLVDFPANVSGVGMAELVEDGKRVPPGLAGGVGVSGGVVDVADAGEGVGFVDPVVRLAEQVERALVAFDGLVVFGQATVRGGKAVPGGGLTLAGVELLK